MAVWNPSQVLNLKPKDEFNCVGLTVKNCRCQNRIHVDDRHEAGVILDTMSALRPDSERVSGLINSLIRLSLCKGVHRKDPKKHDETRAKCKLDMAHYIARWSDTLPSTEIQPERPPSQSDRDFRQTYIASPTPAQSPSRDLDPLPIQSNLENLAALQTLHQLLIQPHQTNEQALQILAATQSVLQLLLQIWNSQSPSRDSGSDDCAPSVSNIASPVPSSLAFTAPSTPTTSSFSTPATSLASSVVLTPASSRSASPANSPSLARSTVISSPPELNLDISSEFSPLDSPITTPVLSFPSSSASRPHHSRSASPVQLPLHATAAHLEATPPSRECDRRDEHRVHRRPLTEECPICQEHICDESSAEWCQGQCGYNVHTDCFEVWIASQWQQAEDAADDDDNEIQVVARCVCCRADWVDQ